MTSSNKGRFPPGHSGNPRGRPRKDAGLAGVNEADVVTIKVASQPVTVTRNGKRKRIKLLEANLVQTFNQGAGGDLGAAKTAVGFASKAFERAANNGEAPKSLSPGDKEIAAAFVERLKRILLASLQASGLDVDNPKAADEGEGGQ